MIAVWRRMLIRISDGPVEMGHGDRGDSSVGRSSTGMRMEEKEAMSSDMVEAGGPCREWWLVLGTVTAILDGLRLVGFDLKDDGGSGGKCFFL